MHKWLRNVAVCACWKSFALKVFDAFETVLVQNMSVDYDDDDDFQKVEERKKKVCTEMDILKEVLIMSPLISHKTTKSFRERNSNNNKHKINPVI